MATDDELFAMATTNRLLAADMFASLDTDQWATPSLCHGWTVREVAAHLIPPTNASIFSLAAAMIRYRGNLDRLVNEQTRQAARLPVATIVATLRARAQTQLKPPGIGAAGPMTDTVIHLRDAARPLGLTASPDPAAWHAAMDFLVSKPALRGFVQRGLLKGLRLESRDTHRAWGTGATTVTGPIEALAMTVAGRDIYLSKLTGPGATILQARLSHRSTR